MQAEPIERPVRPAEPEVPRRAGRSGCLGGLIYFAFVVSISIILACVGWMAASDVLALNKEPVTATDTLDKAEKFLEKAGIDDDWDDDKGHRDWDDDWDDDDWENDDDWDDDD